LVHNREFVLLIRFKILAATFGQFPAVVDEPEEVLAKFFESLKIPKFQGFHDVERDEADQGAHAKFLKVPVRIAQHIVEKTVFFIP